MVDSSPHSTKFYEPGYQQEMSRCYVSMTDQKAREYNLSFLIVLKEDYQTGMGVGI
jgi:hypothetical protein